jgi:hypothetical protein
VHNIIHRRLKTVRHAQASILIDQCDARSVINKITCCRCPFDDLTEDAIVSPCFAIRFGPPADKFTVEMVYIFLTRWVSLWSTVKITFIPGFSSPTFQSRLARHRRGTNISRMYNQKNSTIFPHPFRRLSRSARNSISNGGRVRHTPCHETLTGARYAARRCDQKRK